MIQILNLALALLVLFSWNSLVASTCTLVNPKNQTAYLGWPLILECETAYDYYTFDYVDELTCSITDKSTNSTLYNATTFDFLGDLSYEINNVTATTPTELEIKIQEANGVVCSVQYVHLMPTESPDQTCQDSANDPQESETVQGRLRKFSCEILDSSEAPRFDISAYEVTWYYNCNSELPEGASNQSDGTIEIKANYSQNAGLYSCFVEQNGQKRFIAHYHVCIKPETFSPIISVHCQDKILLDIGGNANITCNVDVGGADMDHKGYFMRFYPLMKAGVDKNCHNGILDEKKDNISCTALLGDQAEKAPDERVSCLFSYQRNASEDDFKCFGQPPTDSEWNAEKDKKLTKLVISYSIKGIRREEFIKYQALVKNEQNGLNETDCTYIEELRRPDEIAAIIGGVIGSVLFLLILALLCFVFRLHLQYWWRKQCAAYAKDVRQYGAYLEYEWEGRGDTYNYEFLIQEMISLLPRIGCPVYDPHHNQPKFQFNVQNIGEVQRLCDRIIIVLTPEYLQEEERDFGIINNFLESFFIFIKTPGVDDVLRSLNPPQRRRLILMALNRNSVINWPGDNDSRLSKKFKMKLELAMPKRRHEERVAFVNGNVNVVDININGNHLPHNGTDHRL